ncbi:MAG: hypothetical protein CR982_09280 [Candidatus Cloacimonadota bacterium]|nr:MAG: hypothetical protein CR982_09280 [Candidatus Cloacimonadota bacterium]PIE77501.1 MAG: hypothetical protein CSA15_12570 [Candidatus Delongbacteria bacterium]
MNKRFILELVVGILLLLGVLIFGEKGMVVFSLLAVLPFIGKRKNLDEREIQLLYKIGNYTAALTLLGSVVIFSLSDSIFMGHLIGKSWLFYVCSIFFISHGASGIFVMRS